MKIYLKSTLNYDIIFLRCDNFAKQHFWEFCMPTQSLDKVEHKQGYTINE